MPPKGKGKKGKKGQDDDDDFWSVREWPAVYIS